MWVQSLEDPLEKEMAIHFSILAWEIPEEPGGIQSMGLQRDMTEQMTTHTHTYSMTYM